MNTKKILIADDDREHLIMLAFMLRKAGYEVISSFDAKNAIQLAVEQDPDLLLLDIHLGDEDGFAIQERLQKIDDLADIPIIYITGDQSHWVQRMTHAVGAFAVVGKPFANIDLLTIINSALNKDRDAAIRHTSAPRLMLATHCATAETYLG